MELKKYFQNPKTDSCKDLLDQISILNKAVKSLVDINMARIPGLVEKFEKYLEKSTIPYKEQDPKKVMLELANYFKGAVRWHHPWTMINITPPPLLPSIAATTITMLFNPNLAIDVSCGGLGLTELEMVKHLSSLVGWDWRKSYGVFTFGGRGTDLYAIKVALQKSCPEFMENGVHGRVAISSTTECHPCHIENCDWLGLGKKNCLRLPVDSVGVLDLKEAEKILSSYLSSEGKLVCIMISGGSTLNYAVDPILRVVRMRNRLIKKFKLDYIPHIHVDSVIGWVWLFFKGYDFKKNSLRINPIAIKKIKSMYKSVSQIKYADSFGVDFHKTGFCPYLSSVFITRKKEWIDNLGTSKQPSIKELEFGNFAPFTYTLESSRPVNGSMAAIAAVKSLGVRGFQKLVSGLVTSAEIARVNLDKMSGFATVNPEAKGFATLFIVLPPKIRITYKELRKVEEELAIKIAEYNHKFYLFLLEKQMTEGSPIALDYVSGYETTSTGIKLGVIKMYVVSPYCNEQSMNKLLKTLIILRREFNLVADNFIPKACPYRPKPLVLR